MASVMLCLSWGGGCACKPPAAYGGARLLGQFVEARQMEGSDWLTRSEIRAAATAAVPLIHLAEHLLPEPAKCSSD